MRCLERNKQTFYYSLYVGNTDMKDENGFYTGESAVEYSPPVEMKANISPASGSAELEWFGNDIAYDKVIVTCDMSCPIDENSVLYIDVNPEDEKAKFDYVVKKVAKSLNSITIACAKVR